MPDSLDPSSSLTVLLDGDAFQSVPLDGTAVPVLTFGILEAGLHTVEFRADLKNSLTRNARADALKRAEWVEVVASTLNIRDEPESASVVDFLVQGERTVVQNRVGEWIRVAHAGKEGWIHGGFTIPLKRSKVVAQPILDEPTWIELDLELEGAIFGPPPPPADLPVVDYPSEIATWVGGRNLAIDADSVAMALELRELLDHWGAVFDPEATQFLRLQSERPGIDPEAERLRGGNVSIVGEPNRLAELVPEGDSMRDYAPRGILADEAGLTLWGDSQTPRLLQNDRILERCPALPCLLPADNEPIEVPPKDWTLDQLGFERGIILEGQRQQSITMPSPGQPRRAQLDLQVRFADVSMEPSSTFSVSSQEIPLATWSLARLDPQGVTLAIEVPKWMLDDPYWTFDLEVDLAEEVSAPWVLIESHSGITWSGDPSPGIAGRAVELAQGAVSLCVEGLEPSEIMGLNTLAPLRGWTDDCDSPDLMVVRQRPDEAEMGTTGWRMSVGDDLVPEASRAFIRLIDGVLEVGLPAEGSLPPVDWPMLRTDLAVSIDQGWSAVGTVAVIEHEVRPDLIETDAVSRKAKVDLYSAIAGALCLMLGLLWIWRGRGDESEWV
jgi:hypothetical protein